MNLSRPIPRQRFALVASENRFQLCANTALRVWIGRYCTGIGGRGTDVNPGAAGS